MAGGQLLSSGQGAVGRAVTVALVGVVLATATGAIVGASGGQEIISGQGSVVRDVSVALLGHEATFDTGTLTPQKAGLTLTGEGITSGQGVVTPTGLDVTVNISGVEATLAKGDVTVGPSTLAGEESATGAGMTAPEIELPLTGSAMALAQGIVASGIDVGEDTYITSESGSTGSEREVTLTGSEMTGETGTLILTDGQEALSGSESTAEAGTTAPDLLLPLSGQEIVTAQYNVGAPGGAALTGAESTVAAGYVFIDNDRTYPLSGAAITSAAGTCFASPVCFYSGQTVVTGQGIIGDQIRALSGSNITAEQGSFEVINDQPRPVRGGGSIIPVPRKGKKFLIKEEETEPTIGQIVDAALAKAKPPLKGRPLAEVLKGQLDATDDDDTIGGEDSEDDDLLIS